MQSELGHVPIENSVTYKDVNLFMERAARDEMVYQTKAVENSIMYILGTPKRQRLMRPTFGSYIHQLLFEPVDELTATKLSMEIYSAVSQWETRVSLPRSGIVVTPDKFNGVFQVNLNYEILELNNLQVAHNFKFRSLRGTQ